MPNIPGILGYIQPQAVSRVRTISKAVSIPGGLRIMAIIGEGLREEVIVDSARGNGRDGFNPDFSTPSDGYGRFFRLQNSPVVQNRTELFLNGSQLRVLEGSINGSSFSSYYDARFEPETGKIELQGASFVDLGGTYYKEGSSNIGDGYLSALTLEDKNAPNETWTIRCVSVLRDGVGAPVRGQATFAVAGTVSGQILNEFGQPYLWKSNGNVVSNGVISFAIFNPDPNQPFDIGDRYTVQIQSKVLKSRDSLGAKYIAKLDVNTPTRFSDPAKLFEKHGQPSVTNTLSLGAQMAFENGSTEVMALQAKPSLPRRKSEIVLPGYNSVTGLGGASGNSNPDDLIFPITAPGKPDPDSNINFFIIGENGKEEQFFPNKVSLYGSTITESYSTYERTGIATDLMSDFMDPSESGMPYSYTVVTDDEIIDSASDGVVTYVSNGVATFYSPSVNFTFESTSQYVDIHNTLSVNNGRWEIDSIIDKNTVRIIRPVGDEFVNESNVKWQLVCENGKSQRLLFTTDLALGVRRGLRISYTDIKDADFFDVGWAEALDVLETQDLQILVPLPTQTVSVIQQASRVHCEIMSSTYHKRERILFTGALKGLSVDNVTGISLVAIEDIGVLEGIQGDSAEDILEGNIEDLADYSVPSAFGDSFRVVYFYPDEIARVVGGSSVLLPGYYMAAAAAGWHAGNPNIIMPVTYKSLVGFTILNSKMFKDIELNRLGDAGITVVQPIVGGGKVQHGKTTTQSGYPEEEEISIVFIRDQIAKTMRRSFSSYVGQPGDPTTAATLTSRAISLLSAFVSQGWITNYQNLSVVRDDVEPRQWNISVHVEPSYPVNWIFIDISAGIL